MNGHPWYAKKVSETGADLLRECKNSDFVWELRKMRFCEGGLVRRDVRFRDVFFGRASTVSDSFPVAPEALLTRTRCIKGRPHENRGATFLSPFPACPATLTSFLPSLSLPLKNK